MIERKPDDLNTPAWLLDLVRSMGPIALDPCGNPWSTVGAEAYCSTHEGSDGLALDWTLAAIGVGAVYVNPPYSSPLPWARKAADHARNGTEVFVLVKNDPSTKWWRELRSVGTARCDFDRRISFDGGAHKSGVFASTLWYSGSRPYLFAHTFSSHGETRVYR